MSFFRSRYRKRHDPAGLQHDRLSWRIRSSPIRRMGRRLGQRQLCDLVPERQSRIGQPFLRASEALESLLSAAYNNRNTPSDLVFCTPVIHVQARNSAQRRCRSPQGLSLCARRHARARLRRAKLPPGSRPHGTFRFLRIAFLSLHPRHGTTESGFFIVKTKDIDKHVLYVILYPEPSEE